MEVHSLRPEASANSATNAAQVMLNKLHISSRPNHKTLAKDLSAHKLVLQPCALCCTLARDIPKSTVDLSCLPQVLDTFLKDTLIHKITLQNIKNMAELKNGCMRSGGERGPCFKMHG